MPIIDAKNLSLTLVTMYFWKYHHLRASLDSIGKRKLSPRYIEPFEILRRYRAVVFELALPP